MSYENRAKHNRGHINCTVILRFMLLGDFDYIGPAGQRMQIGFLCFLFLNNVNEKVFSVLWFWLHVLAFVSAVNCVRTVLNCTLFAGKFRAWQLRRVCKRTRTDVLDDREVGNGSKKLLSEGPDTLGHGLGFVLDLINANVQDERIFKEIALRCLEFSLKASKSH